MPQGNATLLQLSEITGCVNGPRRRQDQMQLKQPPISDTTGDTMAQGGTSAPMKSKANTGSAYPEAPRIAVGAVVFKDDGVLLVQRANPPSQGRWAIPGGSVGLGETLQQAAEREILEETGVVIRAGGPIFVFDVIEPDDRGGVRFHYVIVDLSAQYVSGEPRAADDAADARWIKEAELAALNVNPTTRRMLRKQFNFG